MYVYEIHKIVHYIAIETALLVMTILYSIILLIKHVLLYLF